MGFFRDEKKKGDDRFDEDSRLESEKKLELKSEELDISKHKSKIGDVEIGKEIVSEHKSVDVPITHEEVVIERRALNKKPSDKPIEKEDDVHIPVMDEYVDVGKHTVVTGEVSAHKHAFEENKHVDESLKKEEASIHTDGDPNIVKNETENHRGFH